MIAEPKIKALCPWKSTQHEQIAVRVQLSLSDGWSVIKPIT